MESIALGEGKASSVPSVPGPEPVLLPIDLPIPQLIKMVGREQIEYTDSQYPIILSFFEGTMRTFCHLRGQPRSFVLERVSSACLL